MTTKEQEYQEFISSKSQLDGDYGFTPYNIPSYLFPFQAHLVEWALRKGRAALFADCGMGKTLMQLIWADNVYRHTGKPVLILTPLAVAAQFVEEAERFGVEASRSSHGEIKSSIVITNYERLHLFNSDDFGGAVCDESSILKSFDGVRKSEITEFMRMHKYRLLGTATAAPNDYTELGTSSEALGYLGYMDMLGRFFTNRQQTTHAYHGKYRLVNNDEWRFKGHAEEKFWRWVSSWARALRKPSDLGFSDDGFNLPPLDVVRHIIKPNTPPPGMLFALPAIGLQDQRAERSRTVEERCEMAAELVADTGRPAVVWCNLNVEGDLLEKLIPDGVQVSGKDNDDEKEAKFNGFTHGSIRVLITKPKIGAWGLNWQHCNHSVFFPTYSYEQYYQSVRRFWRFGQKNPVTVDIVATEGEVEVQNSLEEKSVRADQMFTALTKHMNNALDIDRLRTYVKPVEVPSWLS